MVNMFDEGLSTPDKIARYGRRLRALNDRKDDLNLLRDRLQANQTWVEVSVESSFSKDRDYIMQRFFSLFLTEDTRDSFFKILDHSESELKKEIKVTVSALKTLLNEAESE